MIIDGQGLAAAGRARKGKTAGESGAGEAEVIVAAGAAIDGGEDHMAGARDGDRRVDNDLVVGVQGQGVGR